MFRCLKIGHDSFVMGTRLRVERRKGIAGNIDVTVRCKGAIRSKGCALSRCTYGRSAFERDYVNARGIGKRAVMRGIACVGNCPLCGYVEVIE